MHAPDVTPGEELRRLVLGYRISQAIRVAAELNIADLLAGGPRSADDLAAASGAHAPSLYRVLRLLASEGVFAEADDGRFVLTPMAEALQRGAPGSLRPAALFNTGDARWRSWGQLAHSVRTGQPAFDNVHGMPFFEYLRRHPEEWLLFDELMATQTAPLARAMAAAYDFSPLRTVVDVGGGNGALMTVLLRSTHICRASSSTSPPWRPGPRRSSMPRGWETAARPSAATSSWLCPLAAMLTC